MLRTARRILVRALLLIGMLAVATTPAVAEEPGGTVNPCAVRDICVIVVEPGSGTPKPGSTLPGGGGSTGTVPTCTWNGHEWPCWDDKLGWFSTANGCYYLQASPQPPAGHRAWEGHKPEDGKVYEVTCRGTGDVLTPQPLQFFAQPPVAQPPVDNVAELGRRALELLRLSPPVLHAAPTGSAVVGVPVWLWYDRADASVGPVSRTVSGNVISVTATARLSNVSWDTDDGHRVTCTGAGTPYQASAGAAASPDCGHLYRVGSAQRPDGTFYLSATATWRITAVRNDTGAQIADFPWDVPAAELLPLRVAEVQLLN